ncbi:putative inner membrane protein [Polystyrenella longa]|uniref:Putative inner membrane protein n=1 Tax=Polystyrenella longa TaxID=2528007 RepID=A0A518CSQ4_9PLAN|nr:AI-2E family transporter [Polystyrenella longa]QDU82262.1 putative inner membrane protein [Polystyrenella longa]
MPLIPRLVSLGVILTLIIFLGITFYKVITPFLMPLFLAAITAILCQPLYKRCLKWSKGNSASASRLATAIVISGVMLPLVIGISAAAYQMAGLDVEVITQKIDDTRVRMNLDSWIVKLGFDKFLIDENQPEVPLDPQKAGQPEENFDSFEMLPSDDSTGEPEDQPPLLDNNTDVTVDIAVEDQLGPEAGSDESEFVLLDPAVDLDEEDLEEDPPPDPEKIKAVKEEVDQVRDNLKFDLVTILRNVGEKSLGSALGLGNALGMFTGIGSAVGSMLIALLIYILALYYFFADGPSLISSTQNLIPVHVYYQNELLGQFESVVRAIILATLVAAISQGLATAGIMYLFGSGHFFLLFGVATMFAMIPLLGTWLVWGPFAIYLFVQGHYFSAIVLTLFGAVVIGMMDNVIRTLILKDGAKLHPLLAFVSVLGGLQVMGLWGVFIGPTVASCLYALVKIFNVELQSLSAEQFGTQQLEPVPNGKAMPAETEPPKESEAPK